MYPVCYHVFDIVPTDMKLVGFSCEHAYTWTLFMTCTLSWNP